MDQYFIYEDGQTYGPFLFSQLQDQELWPETLIWKEGRQKWANAADFPELRPLLSGPPAGGAVSPPPPPIDYSGVEDVAGVNYAPAMAIAGLYIALHTVIPIAWHGVHGILLSTGLSLACWWYFGRYFTAVGDRQTASWIRYLMGALALYGLLDLLVYQQSSALHLSTYSSLDAVQQSVEWIAYGTLLCAAAVFVTGIRILMVNRHHPFPLKRIALSAMLMIPVYMGLKLVLHTHIIWEFFGLLSLVISLLLGTTAAEADRMPGFWANAVLMLPYLLLLHHFYRADREDRTPGYGRYG